jgi:hypothetical protein
MSKELKVDLSLLNELVKEVDEQLSHAYGLRSLLTKTSPSEDYRKFIIELSKVTGLLSGVAQEAGLLVGDLQRIIQLTGPSKEVDEASALLKSILSPLSKGQGGQGSSRN